MLDELASNESLSRIFPLLPWALAKMQHDIGGLTFADLETGTRATILHNLVMREGERRFAEIDGIDVVNSQGLMHFALPKALIRVKHAHPRSLKISTNQTAQTLQWTNLALTGMADPRDRLHLVYVPDKLWTKITRSVVGVYHGNEAREWRDIDVDAWYEGATSIDTFAPEIEVQPLRLKPGAAPMPLEELDGTA